MEVYEVNLFDLFINFIRKLIDCIWWINIKWIIEYGCTKI